MFSIKIGNIKKILFYLYKKKKLFNPIIVMVSPSSILVSHQMIF